MGNQPPSIHRLSVIVPQNPFAPVTLQSKRHCLCALDVAHLMDWWPGTPHSPHRNPEKVGAIQRSLDWRRVAAIAAYLLQKEIMAAPDRIDKYFRTIYEPKSNEPGRQWPPKIGKVVGYQRSEFPTFSNVLLHVNGARIENLSISKGNNVGHNRIEDDGAANLVFDSNDKKLNFSVIDGQHRINGAYLAICILRETDPSAKWEIPAEVFLDLDPPAGPPRKQAQIFIDVNFYQKKVDKSLVADLFPTARGSRDAIDYKERAQDIGRKLMLEIGPLVGMIQIPGIRYGVKDVVTLATLNGAIEDVLPVMEAHGIRDLELQTEFISQCLSAWLEASGRFESKDADNDTELSPQNVAYQGRILVTVIALIPAMIWKIRKQRAGFVSDKALQLLIGWMTEISKRANLLENNRFISKDKFKELGYHGSGGIGRFRNTLWAALIGDKPISRKMNPDTIESRADANRKLVSSELQKMK